MSDDMQFPADPFWNYSLAVYAQPGFADAAIVLQDEYGLDVNLLLACLWFAAEGGGRLDSDHIREAINRTRGWQSRVVQPLRKVRRLVKTEPEAVADELRRSFRPRLQAIELEAEHVEQMVLSEFMRGIVSAGALDSSRNPQRQAGNDAIQNLLAYLALANVTMDGKVAGLMREIVAPAFPEANLEALTSGA